MIGGSAESIISIALRLGGTMGRATRTRARTRRMGGRRCRSLCNWHGSLQSPQGCRPVRRRQRGEFWRNIIITLQLIFVLIHDLWVVLLNHRVDHIHKCCGPPHYHLQHICHGDTMRTWPDQKYLPTFIWSSPLAKRAGPRAESARAVTGRRCPHSGVGEDFLASRPGPLTKTGVTQKQKVGQ